MLNEGNPFIERGIIDPDEPTFRYTHQGRPNENTSAKQHRAKLRGLEFYILEEDSGYCKVCDAETGEVFTWIPLKHLKPVKRQTQWRAA